MKKILMMLMALVMVLSIAGCGQKEVTETVYNDDVKTETAVEEKEEVVEEVKEETKEEEKEEVVEEVSLFPLTFVDKFGEEVVIEKSPETMISMSPEITEIIFALGKSDQLIGRSTYCNFPEEAANINDFGSLFDLNVESIVEAGPEVIFLSSMASEELVANLKAQDLTVVTFDKDSSFEGTYDYMTVMGQILDVEDTATELVSSIQAEIAEVTSKIEGLEAPTVYYVVWAGGGSDSTATGDTFTHGIITAAGGDNVAKDGTNWSYNVETLTEDDPYLLVCPVGDMKANIAGLPGYSDLTAVVEERVYEVNEDIFSRQGPRIGQAVRVMAEIFHPEVFK